MLRWVMGLTLALAGVAVYLEFMIDIRTPLSPLAMRGALVTANKLPPETLAAATAALKAKFGNAAVVWQGSMGINAKLNGEIVETVPARTFFHEALGITQVADQAGAIATFPFYISPYETFTRGESDLLAHLKMRIGRVFPPASLDVEGDDFAIKPCRNLTVQELGMDFTARVLRLGASTICTIVWQRAPSRRMLIGIAVADGGRWIRPFARRACRMLSTAWLANVAQLPDYLQCLLIDDRNNQPFGSGLSTVAYEIRKDGSLARLEARPRVLEEFPVAPDFRLPTFSANRG